MRRTFMGIRSVGSVELRLRVQLIFVHLREQLMSALVSTISCDTEAYIAYNRICRRLVRCSTLQGFIGTDIYILTLYTVTKG
jgi:hypothetical protein